MEPSSALHLASVASSQIARPGEMPGSQDECGAAPLAEDPLAEDPLVEDLLVEEVSIDGMCGVY